MSDPGRPVGEETMKLGLLMEAAQAHQVLAGAHLEQLQSLTRGLDGVVRDVIRRTLVEEWQAVIGEAERAASALRRLQREAGRRIWSYGLGAALVCSLGPWALVQVLLPSTAQVARLRAQRDALAVEVTRLEQRGGRVEWRTCGPQARLCVRIDRNAPVFGRDGDYFYIVKGT